MQKFLERRRNNKRGHYGTKGFLTKPIYDTITAIASDSTKPTIRETLLAQVDQDINTYLAMQNAPNKTQKKGQSDVNGLTFVSYFTATTYDQHKQIEFAINKLQPYMYFPIGLSEDNQTNLRGLYDTGGCCNMGWLQYHLDIAKRFPDIVKQVINLENIREEPFSIGGIDGSVLITHIIEYYLPYKNGQGDNYTLQVGIVDDFPLNTLFGLPFITKAQLILHLHQLAVTSNVFQTEFEIKQDGPDITYDHPTPPLHIQQQLADDTHPSTFAASSATKEEEEIAAKGILPDGTKPVAVPKRMWRAKAKNVYEEPETTLNDDLDWMFEKHGKVMIREKAAVPSQRDDADVIDWHESIYEEELKQNLQWRDCPGTYHKRRFVRTQGVR